MNKKSWILYVIVITLVVLAVSGAVFILNNTNDNDEDKLQEKSVSELEYLEKTLLSMLNSLNNLENTAKVQASTIPEQENENTEQDSTEQSEQSNSDSNSTSNSSKEEQSFTVNTESTISRNQTNIDWQNLIKQTENIYVSWPTITIDLNNQNVSSEDILTFDSNLDNLAIYLKEQNKTNSLICLANMYNTVAKYIESTSNDTINIAIIKIKANIISAYAIIDTDNWDTIYNFLAQADNSMQLLINGEKELTEKKRNKLDKCYIMLKELIKSSNEKNIDLFYLKYVNLINEF
jgi:hypothetical protein